MGPGMGRDRSRALQGGVALQEEVRHVSPDSSQHLVHLPSGVRIMVGVRAMAVVRATANDCLPF